MMRWIVMGVLGVVLAACADGLTEAERQQQCLRLFKDYDRELRFSAENTQIVRRTIGAPIVDIGGEARAVSGLRQYDCWVDLDDVPDLEVTAAQMQAFRADGVGRLATPEYLHLGLHRGVRSQRAIGDYFTDLGYTVRTTGAPGLGRRLWVGPLETVEARRGAEALASAALLGGTAYTVTRLPYPR